MFLNNRYRIHHSQNTLDSLSKNQNKMSMNHYKNQNTLDIQFDMFLYNFPNNFQYINSYMNYN